MIGYGLPPWKLGSPLRVRPGLIRSERYRKNDGPGCSTGPQTASRVDYYRGGLRLSWSGYGVESIKRPYLSDVATTRRADRSGDGFVIGESRFAEVRKRYPKARLARPSDKFRLGRSALTVFRRTGYEAWNYFTYWFDRDGRLSGLQTGTGGC